MNVIYKIVLCPVKIFQHHFGSEITLEIKLGNRQKHIIYDVNDEGIHKVNNIVDCFDEDPLNLYCLFQLGDRNELIGCGGMWLLESQIPFLGWAYMDQMTDHHGIPTTHIIRETCDHTVKFNHIFERGGNQYDQILRLELKFVYRSLLVSPIEDQQNKLRANLMYGAEVAKTFDLDYDTTDGVLIDYNQSLVDIAEEFVQRTKDEAHIVIGEQETFNYYRNILEELVVYHI